MPTGLPPPGGSKLGRPARACVTCKTQKIRCSGDRPSCTRCTRLKYSCGYESHAAPVTRSRRTTQSSGKHSLYRHAVEASFTGFSNTASRSTTIGSVDPLPIVPVSPHDDRYSGIPAPLVLSLVDRYFDNMYNASFVLHKKLLLESIASGTTRPHILLSVCAWGANFYRDQNGQATLKDCGFMIEWATRAGRLVFQEAEDLNEENLVTFCNLALFWHSQGSWRKSSLHKGNACQLLQIVGIGSGPSRNDTSLEYELRRRRFWTCYLMHCHSPERLQLFAPETDLQNLALPWPEGDFEAGFSSQPVASLNSGQSSGSIFAELVKVLTLWSSVVSSIKSTGATFSTKISDIHSLDEKISSWWQKIPANFKLSGSNIETVPVDLLPKILLVNLVYNQCFCALHASIVPLFSWSPSDGSWSLARKLSAQVAYEHACEVSAIIEAVLTKYPRLSAMPSFVCYAAYSGCAIQIPFMWCLNPKVRERARANVRANVTMIHAMADYWKLAELLKVQVRFLFDIHRRKQTVLEDEPQHVDVARLTDFDINGPDARISILEFTGILKSQEDGNIRTGDENIIGDIEVGDNDSRNADIDIELLSPDTSHNPVASPAQPSPAASSNAPSFQNSQIQPHQEGVSSQQHIHTALQSRPILEEGEPALGRHTQELFNPFMDLEMLDLLPTSELLDLSNFENSFNLDYLDISSWEDTTSL
ncbi:hypothetical protein BX600DRAFT_544414 [Xylariales sp. PMI_506]|nr:hypothetical protein BX600DRAFT_544414 [Xylariales sp. PMI_506]